MLYVVFSVTLKLFVTNIAINKRRRLQPAKCHNLRTAVRPRRIDSSWPVAALAARDEARYWLRIAISAYPTCIRRFR